MKKISHMAILGDSLSDRGTANREDAWGCIPLAWLAGLNGDSPDGRFTNGYVWSDMVGSLFASTFLIEQLKKEGAYANEDLADAVITHDPKIEKELDNYNLKNDCFLNYKKQNFMRSYAEGGLSSYNYSWKPSSSFTRFVTRTMLSHLAQKRNEMLNDDEIQQLSKKQKAQTLVIEWSGANDLITMNARPSNLEVNRALAERIKNLKILIQNGYRHFVLFNLPNLALTPRFQNMGGRKEIKSELMQKNALSILTRNWFRSAKSSSRCIRNAL